MITPAKFNTVADVLATYPDFSIFGEQKFVPKGEFPVTAENFQQYRSYCEFTQDYFFNLWQDFDTKSSRDVREVKAGKSINTTIVSTHHGDIALADYIADCQKLWAKHQATFIQLANEYHEAKQAEEVAQIQEAAELEAALLENSHSEPIAQSVEFTKHNGQKSAIVVKTLTNSETGETFPFSKDFDSDFFCSPTSGIYVWGLYSVIIDRTYGQLIFARTKTPTYAAKRETYYFDDETLSEQFKDLYIDSLDDFCYRAGIFTSKYANIILGAEEPNEEPTTTAPEPTLPPAKKDPYLAEFEGGVESEITPEDPMFSKYIITWGDYFANMDTGVCAVVLNGKTSPLKGCIVPQKALQTATAPESAYELLKAYHERHYTPQGLQMYDCENTDSMFFAKLESVQKQVFAFNANGIALTGVFKYDADIRTYTVVGWDNTRKEPVIMKDPQRFLILETTTAGQYSCSFLSGQNHRSLPVVASQPNVRNTGLQTARLSDAINI